ncbi:MAG: hypothetical protein ACXW32_00435 [Limisphaerales bacterium]
MKKIFIGAATICAALLVGCADSSDSNMGGAVQNESGADRYTADVPVSAKDPGVAPDPGTAGGTPANQSVEERYNTLGSASAPSATVPANVATNALGASEIDTSATGTNAINEQGTQTSPEPRTGDDVNPDSVRPE